MASIIYLPHIQHIFSSAEKLRSDAAKAQLLQHMAQTFLLLGNYERLKDYAEQALVIGKTLF